MPSSSASSLISSSSSPVLDFCISNFARKAVLGDDEQKLVYERKIVLASEREDDLLREFMKRQRIGH